MYEEPEERGAQPPLDPQQRAQERADELRIHAELAAIFEGHRKFDAELRTGLKADIARDVQQRVAKLAKAKLPDLPVVPPTSTADALHVLNLPRSADLTTNDYYIHHRPGEAMIVRWLEGEAVETFYERMQAHFDVALNDFREEERSTHEWKQDPPTLAYLKALDAIEDKMADRYLRDTIRKHGLFILSTLTADQMDILHLCDYIMGVPAGEVVGAASAPPEEPTELDRAWFFKLFSLRGMDQGVEKMCFFAYLQKTEDSFDLE